MMFRTIRELELADLREEYRAKDAANAAARARVAEASPASVHERLRLAAGETRTVAYTCERGRSRIESGTVAEVLRTLAVADFDYERRGSGGAYDAFLDGRLVACVVSSEGFAYAFTTENA